MSIEYRPIACEALKHDHVYNEVYEYIRMFIGSNAWLLYMDLNGLAVLYGVYTCFFPMLN